MALAVMAHVLGIAFSLTGATDCGRRVFVAVAGLVAYELWRIASATNHQSVRLVLQILAVALVTVPVLLHLWTVNWRHWREHPAVEVATWLLVLWCFVAAEAAVRNGSESITSALVYGLSVGSVGVALIGESQRVQMIVLIPVLLILSLEPVNLAVDIGRTSMRLLAGHVSGRVLRQLAMLLPTVFWLALLAVTVVYPSASLPTDPGALAVMLWLFAPLFVHTAWIVWLARAGRWSYTAAACSFALVIAQIVLIAAIFLAGFAKQDFVEVALSAPGVIPPILLFVLLTAYNVLTFGARYANSEGQLTPRTGRSLMYFGAVLWLLSTLLFSTSLRPDDSMEPSQALQELFSGFFFLGLALFGPPYLAWIVWRRRERLTGAERVGSTDTNISHAVARPG